MTKGETMKKAFVLGGTGFLGYHTVNVLLEDGYEVIALSLPPMPVEDLFDERVENQLGDVNDMSDEELLELMKGCSDFVYAIGADERWLPDKPAFKSFYQANVLPTQRIARLCVKAGIKNFVLYGSYFSEFAEKLPQFKLNTMGYPATRLLQEQIAYAEGEGSMCVTTLRLPYIFGTMPGRVPLWKMFTDLIKGQETYPYPSGKTASVSAHQVAQATLGALKHGVHRQSYAISDTNISHKRFYELMVEALGQQNTTQLISLPYEALVSQYQAADNHADSLGKEHGIHIVLSQRMNNEDLSIDPQDTIDILGYERVDDMEGLIRETLKACVEAE